VPPWGGGGGGGAGGGGDPMLSDEAGKRRVVDAVERLWASAVTDALDVDACVLDVFVDGGGHAWVVDLAPGGEAGGADPLLFTWAELQTMGAAAAAAASAPPPTAAGGDRWHPWLRCAADGESARVVPSRAMYDGVPLELRQPGSTAALVAAATELINREREEPNQRR